jgi:hypothetical protein
VYEQVTEWYKSWKDLFPKCLKPLLANQFRFGLDLMNNSMLGTLKEMPPLPIPMANQDGKVDSVKSTMKSRQVPSRDQFTFMDYVGKRAAEKGVEFVPMVGRTHSETGKPLFKMTGIDGLSILVYMDKGVLFMQSGDRGEWGPVSVDEVVAILAN